jgi:hypothetical protein
MRALPPIPRILPLQCLTQIGIVGCARGEGFNRRVSISVLEQDARASNNLHAPKLSAGAAEIEFVLIPKGSLWDDFERFILSLRLISL